MAYFIIGTVLLLLFLFYMVYQAHHDTVEYETINDPELPRGFDGFRIFFISDIHRRVVRKTTLQSITDKMDMVVIGGDLTEKGVPLNRTKENIKRLKLLHAPIYFVWGNNDYEADPEAIYKLLCEEDVMVLANAHHNITTENNGSISVLGLDCCYYKEARLDLAMENSAGEYYILITHAPKAFYELTTEDQKNINLVLAGHTHGGQIRIFGFGLYQKGGLERYDKTNVLVSEGYGYTGLPFRLGTKAECHVITLKC
ncbi:metallophosphoesterase family protein [Virgibacillus dakarensis]|nr:metallophosphoesterase family protein [Virgibacillus dakarensis]